jgi:lipopolysaccharide export system protein LptA
MKFVRKFAAAVLSAATLSSAYSLPDDRNQPIEIQANSADRSTKTGITTYTGNVDMKQGSIHVTADVVVLNSENNELSKIVATGKLATYEQQLTGPDDKVEARAERIHFDIHQDRVTLEGSGNLTQKGGSISGEHIE